VRRLAADVLLRLPLLDVLVNKSGGLPAGKIAIVVGGHRAAP
jgi:hypothetical protein